MRNNQIKILPDLIFEDLENLEVLDLSYNLLVELSESILMYTPKIFHLGLTNNYLIKYPDTATLSKLRDMYTDNNGAIEIQNNSFDSRKLQNLMLSNNELSVLRFNLFHRCVNLVILDLTKNRLPMLHEETFRNLSKLKH